MKPGLKIGATTTIQIEVTPQTFAQFEGEVIHPAYSTVSMIYHMELVSRKMILPFLEEHEEGMGGAVNAKHIAPSPEGSLLTITAELIDYKQNTLVTKVTVYNDSNLVGIGEVKQFILPKQKIAKLLNPQSQ